MLQQFIFYLFINLNFDKEISIQRRKEFITIIQRNVLFYIVVFHFISFFLAQIFRSEQQYRKYNLATFWCNLFFFGPFFGWLSFWASRAALTSQKWAEKAKNVLAIKILYQNLKKSTFKLQRPEFFVGRLLGQPYQPKRSTSRKWAEKPKNVLAIKILYQNL